MSPQRRPFTNSTWLAASALSLALTACSVLSPTADNSRRVVLDGLTLQVSQLTEGTWTVSGAQGGPANLQRVSRAALITAVETTSGCKVTDSDFSQEGRQFDAQVDCTARAK